MTSARRSLRLPVPIQEFAQAILKWYSGHRRDLPWRQSDDPYRIWVSEVMLQQTQVKTVVPYYERFLNAYPTLEALAEAEVEEVLDIWAGLGYYRRALNLHRAAQKIMQEHQGRFPIEFKDALALPGVGRYSAGAVLSIAHGMPHPVLDGNVSRVLARYLKIETPVKGSIVESMWTLLEEVVQTPPVTSMVSEFNQGLMELGALVCLPTNPSCSHCPLTRGCGAFKDDVQNELPVRADRSRSIEFNFVSALIRGRRAFLMSKNEAGPILKGFWEFPRVEGKRVDKVSLAAFRMQYGLNLSAIRELDRVRHTITFRKLNFYPFEARVIGRPPIGSLSWVQPGQKGFPMSAYIRKILKQLE